MVFERWISNLNMKSHNFWLNKLFNWLPHYGNRLPMTGFEKLPRVTTFTVTGFEKLPRVTTFTVTGFEKLQRVTTFIVTGFEKYKLPKSHNF